MASAVRLRLGIEIDVNKELRTLPEFTHACGTAFHPAIPAPSKD
jgi:hypothetical protein